MKKKILIHSIAFSPDGVSTAYLYNDIALKFRSAGYDVAVMTTTPHYNIVQDVVSRQPLRKKWLGLYYESDFHGIRVKHIPQKKFKRAYLRIAGFMYWHFLSLLLGLFEKRISIILSPSPPLSIGVINLILGRVKRAKVIYNVQEIYPDFLIEQGGLKNKWIIRLLKRMEKFVYNRSDAVTTIDDVFYGTIADRFTEKNKLHIIPNFVDTQLYKPLDPEDVRLDPALFPENDRRLKVMYAGNIGHAQHWDPLIKAAIMLRNDPIIFIIIGEGVMKDQLAKLIAQNKLENIQLLPYQPREMMPQLIAYSDLQFIFMSKEMEGHGFPSKVYTIMACGKPLIIRSGENTPITRFLTDKECAYIISNHEEKKQVDNIVSVLRATNKQDLSKMGANGFRHIQHTYSSDVVTEKYVQLAEKLLHD